MARIGRNKRGFETKGISKGEGVGRFWYLHVSGSSVWVNGWESAVCESQGLAGDVLWIVTVEVNAFVIYCGIMQEDLPRIRQRFLRSPHHFRGA